ncbi:MAG: simple sugar transport system permease protein [Ilumatobacteraceae bacterium]
MTATEVPTSEAPVADSPVVHADERIAHRGPMQRWLVSPEIGALIGAIIVWIFFWGNARTFGQANSTLNWLDVAAPTGIMATAVALLMIGGEFDLSSGVMTGASAITIGLMSRTFMGTGINIGWAIGAAFLIAAAVGWFNGFMVNKTGLPSFIVTLASFFGVRGMIVVLSQRLVGKVQVDSITKQRGAAGFKNWIAHEWQFKEFSGRDTLFLALVIAGSVAFLYGLLEQSFTRRSTLNTRGSLITVVGVAGVAIGFVGLLQTDGVGKNFLFGLIGGLGLIATMVGLAMARWQSRIGPIAATSTEVPRSVVWRLGLGVAGIALACVTHIPFDRHQRLPVLTWTSPGLRPVLAWIAALAGIGLAIRALLPSLRGHWKPVGVVKLVLLSAYCGLLLMAGVLSFLQLTTVQALRTIAMLLLGGGGILMMLTARGRAGQISRSLQLMVGLLVAAAVIVLAVVVRADSAATRFRTGMFAAMMLGAIIIVANSLLEFVMLKRHQADHHADSLGKKLQMAGAGAALVGLIVRLIFTNFTAAHAARVKAAGGNVGQNVLRETVVWWVIVAAIGAFVLSKTKWGNWIFAVGGNRDAARAIGVPAGTVKISLFVTVSLCGCLAGTLIALRYGTVQANQGIGLEFEYIIAAVVGGCLMTGGYGSVIGASLGAIIMAISTNGVQSTGWNSDGRYTFLGGVLLLAVLVNNYTRKKAQEAR